MLNPNLYSSSKKNTRLIRAEIWPGVHIRRTNLQKINMNMSKDMRELVKEGYEKSHYDGSSFRKDGKQKKIERYFLRKLVKLVPKSATVLDLGCGTGVPVDAYLIQQGFDVTGVDYCPRLITRARRNVPQGKFINQDFSRVSFDEEAFDAVVSLYAIFHIPRKEHKDLFLRIRSLLKHNGIMLVTLGTSDYEYGEEQGWCGAPVMAWSMYGPDTYEEMITNIGFTILESRSEGKPTDDEYHFWMLAQKE